MAVTRTRIGVDEPEAGVTDKYVGGSQVNDGTKDVVLQHTCIADPETLARVAAVNASGQLTVIEANSATIDADTGAIKTAVELIDNAISGTEMQVDVVAALPAGANAIGKLAANSGVDIGDVDVTSVVPGTAATNLGKAVGGATGATDTGIAALVVRDDSLTTLSDPDGDYVPLRVGSTGALHVTGGGGGTEYTEDVATANPIVGTATMMERDDALAGLTPAEGDWAALRCSAEGALWTQDFNSDAALALLGTIDADTGAIKTAVELIDNAVDGSYLNTNMNVAGTDVAGGAGVLTAQTLRVTIATDDECNNFLGAIDADTSNIATSIQAIDGAIIGPGEPTIDSYTHAVINLGIGVDNVLASSAANKQIWVYGYGFACGTADGTSVSFQDEDDTALTGTMLFAQYGGTTVAPSGNFSMPLFKCATDKDLEVDVGGGDIDGWLTYAIVSV